MATAALNRPFSSALQLPKKKKLGTASVIVPRDASIASSESEKTKLSRAGQK